ncbi:uncharacterized protein LOC106166211 [Lingula anatina]|uniref:Uncharacterized protein LOC106166211 n=1 Tax=Lingula anatina TaxID=7574 RepID=A0A1S3IPJ8_LINAN|nr:uncharacterized protein LOC106166211 [Lingula anatina]|eukprot:XP_013400145.1 uncharacterized protein LOC106166211 [Lingula anatina]
MEVAGGSKTESETKHAENEHLLKAKAKEASAELSPTTGKKKQNKKVTYAGSTGSNEDLDFVHSCPTLEERKEMAKAFRKRTQSECSTMSTVSIDSKGMRKRKGSLSRRLRRAFSLSEDPEMTPAYSSFIPM